MSNSRWRPKLPSQAHNWNTIRNTPLAEISGSLGDLGTLLPLLIALTLTGSIDLSTTLVFTGLSNLLTGLAFRVPLPVQPMKAIAAVAIANNFSKEETASAGIFVASVVALCSITGTLNWIGRVVPIPVIKGIQVGAGLTLVIGAGQTLLQPLGWVHPYAGDNLIWALAAFLLLLIVTGTSSTSRTGLSRIPYALIVFIIGLIISFVALSHTHHTPNTDHPIFAIWRPRGLTIRTHDFKVGAFTAGLGQLPLTLLNSIIAVTHLSAELLPAQPAPTPFHLGISVALMNLIACPLGAMPTCHGSGGLAAQVRFGARSGASIVFLGLVKLLLGLIFHETALVSVLQRFPKSILGIMVIAAGVELARVGEGLNVGARDLWEEAENEDAGGEGTKMVSRELDEKERRDRWMVMMVTVAGLLAFKNDAVGFIAGLLCHWSMRAPRVMDRPRWMRGRGDEEGLLGERT